MASKRSSVLTPQAHDFLNSYINIPSPTGFECRLPDGSKTGQQLWLEYIKQYTDESFVDTYGTAVGIINPKEEYKIVIEAHADEISWYVHYITKDGFIYLRRNGGMDHQIAPSKRVNLFLDCGVRSDKELEKLGVHVGCVVTYEDEFMILNDNFYVGRALDNRMGGFMIAQVARLLKEKKTKLPFGLYVVNSVQEEVGLNGARMIASNIKPAAAIITDVTHDTQTPMMNKIGHGDIACGKGPALTYGPAVHNNLLDQIIATANKNKISFQREVASRSTGTDTDAFAYSGSGIASALISLPLRYMHTTVESVHRDDVESVIKLIYECLRGIKKNQKFNYL
jgi:putative aminopeptidase FrvX